LRGRAGRQGDPGSSHFFISMDDEIFIKYRLNELLADKAWLNELNGEIDNPYIKTEVARVQRICEGQNLEIKKTLFKYSTLMEKQRTVLYNKRDEILFNNIPTSFFSSKSPENYNKYLSIVGVDELNTICKKISFFHIDNLWSYYLAEIAEIREGIHLKRVGGQEPYIEFQKIAIQLFDKLYNQLDGQLLKVFNSIKFTDKCNNLDELGIKKPSATWTYIVNDNPFENIFGIQLIGDAGLQIGAAIMTPFLALHLFFRKRKKRKNR
jgi:preprotein translocase subunit SecA